MDSQKNLKILYIVFFAFIIHLFFYFFLTPYNNFFKNLKYWEELENVDEFSQEYLVNDNFEEIPEITPSLSENNINNNEWTWSRFLIPDINNESWWIDPTQIETEDSIPTNSSPSFTNTITNTLTSPSKANTISNTTSSKLTTSQKQILSLFSRYSLKEKNLSDKSVIFSLTDEYPYKYLEYSSSDNKTSFYIFTEKRYEDIINVFDVISYNLYYSIKKVNNFGDYSFYINMDEGYNDWLIRIVFSFKNETFWLKIKKDDYNEIKKILLTIK